jgi:DNA-directed RNA polymerase subunit N (RpoN/RPB10)
MSRSTVPVECPSCGDQLLGYDWQEYINHVAEHDDLAGRIARRMVRHHNRSGDK